MWRKCGGTDERKMSREEKIIWRTEKRFVFFISFQPLTGLNRQQGVRVISVRVI